MAYFLSDTVDALDLKAFYTPYAGDGRRNSPYDPRMMVKLLLYGYATGTFSSRKIAKKVHEDVAFRVLAGENFPAHRTISEFRQRHLLAFQELFVQVLEVARESGLLQMGTVAVDGTKVKASASKRKAMSYGRMKQEHERLKAEIAELTSRAAEVDAQEDAQYGSDNAGDEMPEELKRREQRLGKIQEAIERLRSRQVAEDRVAGRKEVPACAEEENKSRAFGEPPEKKQDNFTDPESRIMKTSSGFEQCYNGQLAVDSESRLILAAKVTQSGADHDELLPVLEEARANVGQFPQAVLADAGYRSEENLQKLEVSRIEAYVALGREGKKAKVTNEDKHPATQRMKQKLETEEGRKCYSKRKSIVEPVNGWIKSVLGFRQFSLRGLKKVSGEWTLVCLALNLRQMRPLLQAL
jgi:transposase